MLGLKLLRRDKKSLILMSNHKLMLINVVSMKLRPLIVKPPFNTTRLTRNLTDEYTGMGSLTMVLKYGSLFTELPFNSG